VVMAGRPGIALPEAAIKPFMEKGRPGQSKFVTQRQEPDTVKILSGTFQDERMPEALTTGTPISLMIENVDQRSKDYGEIRDSYRPGHADYAYDQKYGVRDYRGGGRSSARETCMPVAAGAIPQKYLRQAFRGCDLLVAALLLRRPPLAGRHQDNQQQDDGRDGRLFGRDLQRFVHCSPVCSTSPRASRSSR